MFKWNTRERNETKKNTRDEKVVQQMSKEDHRGLGDIFLTVTALI